MRRASPFQIARTLRAVHPSSPAASAYHDFRLPRGRRGTACGSNSCALASADTPNSLGNLPNLLVTDVSMLGCMRSNRMESIGEIASRIAARLTAARWNSGAASSERPGATKDAARTHAMDVMCGKEKGGPAVGVHRPAAACPRGRPGWDGSRNAVWGGLPYGLCCSGRPFSGVIRENLDTPALGRTAAGPAKAPHELGLAADHGATSTTGGCLRGRPGLPVAQPCCRASL